ncbi:MAG TPA: hypothetical protein VEH06_07785 [Candidatus Bathyarchaeia archaeon]|nr:hypothetical protein [Candidatus Bathyarchaeia archaeon]
MKQIIFGAVIAILLSGFFVEQAFAQAIGSNGGMGGSGTTGTATNGGVSANGNTTNGKNGTSANGHSIGGSGD